MECGPWSFRKGTTRPCWFRTWAPTSCGWPTRGCGIEILRAPAGDEVEEFRRRPHVFGLPILFPPNRIADGRYTFDGRTYRFPITDAKGGHYHHGILKSQPFAVSKAWETADEVLVECRYYSNAGNDAIFRDFPHEFKCKITLPPYGRRAGAGGDVRQPQCGVDARGRGVSYADADSLSPER